MPAQGCTDTHFEFNFSRALRRAKRQGSASGLLHPLLHQTCPLLHQNEVSGQLWSVAATLITPLDSAA
jgi:hypothetical protein